MVFILQRFGEQLFYTLEALLYYLINSMMFKILTKLFSNINVLFSSPSYKRQSYTTHPKQYWIR